ncbi:MAG TPA: tripartite tricarboxylate transporter substrate binding protein [Xanthobacteraceae bacterium]|jgi:tripartite-type tricarboxylate transporter receptor subunit TctC|nr:tripartite tricarboxylate transporter substrate binding protein [Xanthobacteraceae bacterium]
MRARIRKSLGSVAAAVVATFLWSADGKAQSWPDRPVKIVAPFAAGGAADTLGRIIADNLSRSLNQQFIVENQPGAGGMIGAQAVARAKPDGYTFVISGIASHVIAPLTSQTAPHFDPIKDFTHVAYLGGPPIILVVHPSVGVTNFKDFVAHARSTNLSYASPGTGTHMHLFAEYLAAKEGIKFTHIPFRGTSPALTAVLGGHVPVGMTWSAVDQIQSGKLNALGVSAERRLPDLPDVPTFKEIGYPDLTATTWFSLSGPAGLPQDIVVKLHREIAKVLKLEVVQRRLAENAIEVREFSPAELTAFVASELKRWQPVANSVRASAN